MKKHAFNTALLLVSLGASGCGSVTIKNWPLYWPQDDVSGVVTYTLQDGETPTTWAEWKKQHPQRVETTYDAIAWFRETIEVLCAENKGKCKGEVKANVDSFLAATSRAKRKKK